MDQNSAIDAFAALANDVRKTNEGRKAEREEMRQTQMSIKSRGNKKKKGPYRDYEDFPIIVTSFELCIIDRPYLEKYMWKYLVVDEGQRIKNRESRVFNELEQIPSGNRLLLSGTPIQNKLEELWTLLNFVQPNIFDDLEVRISCVDADDIMTC